MEDPNNTPNLFWYINNPGSLVMEFYATKLYDLISSSGFQRETGSERIDKEIRKKRLRVTLSGKDLKGNILVLSKK